MEGNNLSTISTIVQDTYNQIARAYTNRYANTPFLQTQVKNFAQYLPIHATILDVGCGSGRAYGLFTPLGFVVTGIDFSKEMLRLAQEHFPRGDFRYMDIRKLDFPSESFNGIWSHFSLLHIEEKDVSSTLTDWYRVLKPGGTLFIATSLGRDTEGLEDEWLKKGTKMFFHGFSKGKLRKFLQNAHFLVKKITILEDAEENDNVPILYVYAQKKWFP